MSSKPKEKAKPSIEPLEDRLLVRRVEPREQTKGGIIIPEIHQERSEEAEVVAVGPGRIDSTSGMLIAMNVNPGDRVLLGKYAGTEVQFEGEKLVIIRESDVLARLNDLAI